LNEGFKLGPLTDTFELAYFINIVLDHSKRIVFLIAGNAASFPVFLSISL